MVCACSTHQKDKCYIQFKLENLKGRDHLGDIGVNWWIILKWFLRKHDMRACTIFIWFRTGTSGRLFWMW